MKLQNKILFKKNKTKKKRNLYLGNPPLFSWYQILIDPFFSLHRLNKPRGHSLSIRCISQFSKDYSKMEFSWQRRILEKFNMAIEWVCLYSKSIAGMEGSFIIIRKNEIPPPLLPWIRHLKADKHIHSNALKKIKNPKESNFPN